MQPAMKIILSIVAFVASYIFIYFALIAFIPSVYEIYYLPNVIALILAIAISIYVWKKTSFKNGLTSHMVMGGIIVGSISFIIGFFGPIIFVPDSNQGPLFGIFISGPVGILVGLIAGAVFWKIKQRKQMAKLG